MTSFQTIVLSGGGAKGPYGLGVLVALEKYHQEREKEITKIYCGTSVGALNATLAAQGDLKKLTTLYSESRTNDILGTDDAEVRRLKMAWVSGRKPFHYFENTALKAIIERYVDLKTLTNGHLIICATNYRTGDLETFYISTLVDEFLGQEQSIPRDQRRLINYHRIASREQLVDALLASTAIPFYFPPVKIGNSFYIDGGVGNNTPLRQAAYINRFLSLKSDAQLEPTFCVINDPSRFTIAPNESIDIFGVIRRTMDIFSNELVKDDCVSWNRINEDVLRAERNENLLSSDLEALGDARSEEVAILKKHIKEALHATNAAIPRVNSPLMIVQPSTPLLDNTLQFDPDNAERLRRDGIADCLNQLQLRDFITPNDLRRWNEEID